MNPTNTTELVTQIISNPNFASDIYNYINNIKPKLDELLSRTPILDEVYNRLNDQSTDNIKEILKKFKSKYDKLKEEYNKKDDIIKNLENQLQELQEYKSKTNNLNKDKIIENLEKNKIIENLEKEINQLRISCSEKDKTNTNILSQIDTLKMVPPKQVFIDCQVCPVKDRIITSLESKQKKECSECPVKDKLISTLELQCNLKDKFINNFETKEKQGCLECNLKDKIINNFETKDNYKEKHEESNKICTECIEKNNLINKLKNEINTLHLNCEEKDKEIYKLTKQKQKYKNFKDEEIQKDTQKDKQDNIQKKVEPKETIKSQNVVEEVIKQIGNFITIPKKLNN